MPESYASLVDGTGLSTSPGGTRVSNVVGREEWQHDQGWRRVQGAGLTAVQRQPVSFLESSSVSYCDLI
ncbi:hypothetical protein N658DRAFT_501127, partial [Parathielavia hyrcaniae]